jgi:hypothetical protein
MIVVRNCFVAKPGNASKLAAQLKEAAATAKFFKYRVLADLTGDFNRVILEYEAENVGEFEARMKCHERGIPREDEGLYGFVGHGQPGNAADCMSAGSLTQAGDSMVIAAGCRQSVGSTAEDGSMG